ncbi:MAG: GGDEF domain-containing protein, partial [Treponema sp.]|nr:GGDEF domain-containing protein [Treponema sp.]
MNTALGSCFIVILIALDYSSKYNTDKFQRKLVLGILAVAVAAILSDFICRVLKGKPGAAITSVLYLTNSLFYISQNFTYYLMVIFIDYFAYNNVRRAKKIISIVLVFLSVYFVSVIANLYLHFYFSVGPTVLENGEIIFNDYIHGKLFNLRLIISYLPIALIILEMILASKYFKQSQIYLVAFFALLTGFGATLDVLLKQGSLTWPCFVGALLYIYFFIIQSDSKIDSLTGIGNRQSFNEFIEKLSRSSAKESWSIVMIDMDHFKQINDTLGHLEGDNALRDMATILKGCIRHSDFAARYGGDEFVLAASAEYNIEMLMTRIQQSINNQNEKHLRPYQIAMSYGYDVYTTNSGRSIKDFLNHIDALMY